MRLRPAVGATRQVRWPADPVPANDLSALVDGSQYGELSALVPLIGSDWPRFVVDVGAHDGYSLSNSRPLIELGWSGVLIEPLPAAYRRLEQLYRERADVQTVEAACAASPGRRALFVGADTEVPMTSTLEPGPGDRIDVPVETLTGVLERCGAPRDISLLLVDAEGLDHEVLAALDFDRFRPRAVVSEDYLADPVRHTAKYELLLREGYVLHALAGGVNSIWVERRFLGGATASGAPSRDGLLEQRCAELERLRDETWRELATLRESRSWKLTAPLRSAAAALRRRG